MRLILRNKCVIYLETPRRLLNRLTTIGQTRKGGTKGTRHTHTSKWYGEAVKCWFKDVTLEMRFGKQNCLLNLGINFRYVHAVLCSRLLSRCGLRVCNYVTYAVFTFKTAWFALCTKKYFRFCGLIFRNIISFLQHD